ncbi:retrovirus-related pol polyprotein from transposon TNT 1-94 [Tanacetum coccineum]|uniref:Retrovirus-related pol polyprotein from transposon TNT 1-94 n=1 Tax=Tanacetum coccineum TaxID=301880 RepID=A0ABQ5DUH7_9ASTR
MFMCHIIGIELQFENIIKNGPFIPMTSSQRNPENQWTEDERKAANLDQRLKSLIMSVLPDDQMNSDFQDSPDDEDDTRSSQEYLNDLEDVYQARALLAKSKRFFKKDEEEVSSDDNEMVEVKVLMALAEENDVVSKEGARNGEWVKISMRKVHTLLEIEDNDDRKVCLDYLCIDLNYVEEQRSNLLSKHRNLVHELNTCKEQLLVLKQAKLDFLTMQHVNTEILKENKNLRTELKELKAITKTWLNSSNKVNQCISEQIPSQKKRILGVDQLTEDPSSSGQKDLVFVKSSADDTKVTIPGVERPWLSEAEGFILPNHDTGRILLAESQRNTTDPSVPVTDPSMTVYDFMTIESSSCERTDHRTCDHAEYISTMNMIISLEREINLRNPQHAFKRCEACGSSTHTTTDHYDIEWFKRGEALQAKKAKALKSTRVESSNANRSKTPTKSGCLRHMTGVKSYLHKYVEQPRPKVVFGDDFTCTTEGYGSIKCNGIVFTKVEFVNGLKYNLISISQLCDAKYIVHFDEKRGTIFNSNKEIVMIAPRIWHKRLAHLNFKTINKLAKQNLVIVLPSLVYSKDKPCSSCEKGKIKHHKASFKTKQISCIKKCLHLLHIDLFGSVNPSSINHEKYTLVIVDEYSRYTWVYFLKKKSQAPETIMSFIKRVENQNDIKIKQLKNENGIEFRNSTLINFCDEKGISQNFSSPYTPKQNGIA